MKVLLVKLKLIGDALLLTGTVRALKQARPDAEIHVVVRKGTEGILVGCPEISTIHTAGDKSGEKGARLRRDLALVRRLWQEKFAVAIELGDGDRGRFLAVACGAPRRFANITAIRSWHWKRIFSGSPAIRRAGKHAAVWDLEVVRAAFPEIPKTVTPTPVFDRDRAIAPDSMPIGAAPVFIHPVASRPGKLWTTDGWIRVARHALNTGRPVILSSGPASHEITLCRSIAKALPSNQTFVTEGRLNWAQVAGLLFRSAAYVGTDTAAMHLAAACGIPVLALFAHPPESRPELWHPLCRHSRILMTDSPGHPLAELPSERVIDALQALLSETLPTTPILRHENSLSW